MSGSPFGFWGQHISYLEVLLSLLDLVARKIASKSGLTCKHHRDVSSMISGLYDQVDSLVLVRKDVMWRRVEAQHKAPGS